jgi:phage tail sheath protein FI
MPVTPTYPGVYIEEIPSGVRTIIGVATSITAFVGRALRGPADEAVIINSFGDFERIFGGLWSGSKLGFAVRDFYLNGGSQAIIVRLFNPSEADRVKAEAAAQEVATAAKAAANGATAKTAANVKRQEIVDNANRSEVEKQAARDVAQHLSALPDAATQAEVATAADEAVGKTVPRNKAELTVKNLTLEAAYPGLWGNYLRARVDHDVSADVAADFGVPDDTLFNLTIRDMKTGVTELFRNLTVIDSPRRVDNVLKNESRLARVKGGLPIARPEEHDIPNPDKDVFHDDNNPSKVEDGGKATDGKILEQENFTGSGKEAAKKGLYALEKADLFNLLCIPPYKADGDIDAGLIDRSAAYCEKRRAFLLIDPPVGWIDKDEARDGVEDDIGAVSKNAAVFFPRLKQPNPLRDNQMEDFAPCGAVAGVFARTDAQRGVWKAPAGLEATLVGVPQLSVNLTDAENGELNPKGINCLRTLPAAGRVVWGSRTRVGNDRLASEWKYIPVRRTALFIEETLYRALHWVVFEPNDEPLWAQIRLNVGAFMNTLFRQGAFQGSTPREAYFVKCDKETTTQNDIDRGVVNIVVGFAPLKPAEFVIIKLQQIAGQIQT